VNLIKFSSLKEWDNYNKQIANISIKNWKATTIIKRCCLVYFHPYVAASNNIFKKPLISIHKIKFIYPEKIYYIDEGEMKGSSYYNSMIIVQKKDLPLLKPIIDNFLSYYVDVAQRRLTVEKAKKKWVAEQMKRIRLEANERFKIDDIENKKIEELLQPINNKKDISYCEKCEQYYFSENKENKCPVCNKVFITAFDKNVKVDILLDSKIIENLKKEKNEY